MEQRQVEEDRKKAEKEAKERDEEEVRGRVAMEMQHCAQLDIMLHEKETERGSGADPKTDGEGRGGEGKRESGF